MYISFVYISKEDSFLENTIDLAYIYIYIQKGKQNTANAGNIRDDFDKVQNNPFEHGYSIPVDWQGVGAGVGAGAGVHNQGLAQVTY